MCNSNAPRVMIRNGFEYRKPGKSRNHSGAARDGRAEKGGLEKAERNVRDALSVLGEHAVSRPAQQPYSVANGQWDAAAEKCVSGSEQAATQTLPKVSYSLYL